MSETHLAPLHTWLIEPMEQGVETVVQRLRRAPDVRHVAIMPDVHLADAVTVGTVMGKDHLLYPQAVGGDIGCGMLAVAFDARAEQLADPSTAGRMLSMIDRAVPATRRTRNALKPLPDELKPDDLSHPALRSAAQDEGRLQLGTLGSGNHFIELQADESERLWLMIHSGSRAMGQVIRAHHMARADVTGSGLRALDADTDLGRAYAQDVQWARRYADANRRIMARTVAEVAMQLLGASVDWSTLIAVDHNHVAREVHEGRSLWVHRKGAMPASAGAAGVLPGSMGTLSHHVEGRGCPRSLCSSAHGAGRAFSREKARAHISVRDLQRQMAGVWYDYRHVAHLREEAPAAYKDLRAVLRAQHELVKVTRTLRPLLSFKCR